MKDLENEKLERFFNYLSPTIFYEKEKDSYIGINP